MSREDCYGLLFLGYFALVIAVGVGVFAHGATALATLLVAMLAAPFIGLLALASAVALADEEPAA